MYSSYAPLTTSLSPDGLPPSQRPQPLLQRQLWIPPMIQIAMFTIDPVMHLLRRAQCMLSSKLLHDRQGVWAE